MFFLCKTPAGADWVTCPVCDGYKTTIEGDYDFCDGILEDNIKYISDNIVYIGDNLCNKYDIQDIIYCIKCKIIFKVGSVFKERGCTDSTYFVSMIKSFTFNGITYTGVPVFKSNNHWKNLLNNNKIKLNWKKSC
jgi:hypothetical protein